MNNLKTNNMKQTAVEWLFQELWNRPKDRMVWHSILEKALQREKEQREKDFINGYKNKAEMSNSTFDEISEDAAKELFKQTFKSE